MVWTLCQTVGHETSLLEFEWGNLSGGMLLNLEESVIYGLSKDSKGKYVGIGANMRYFQEFALLLVHPAVKSTKKSVYHLSICVQGCCGFR